MGIGDFKSPNTLGMVTRIWVGCSITGTACYVPVQCEFILMWAANLDQFKLIMLALVWIACWQIVWVEEEECEGKNGKYVQLI